MNNKLRFIIIFFIFVCGSIAIPPWYSEWEADFSTYAFNDEQAALSQLIKNEQETAALIQSVIEYEPFKLEDYVIHKTKGGDADYYTINIHYEESKIHKDDLYIAKIHKKYGKYKAERASATFALNAPGSDPDVKYTPYVKYKIKVEGIYFVLGKVFDDKYQVFLNNQPVNSNGEGVFVISGNKEQAISVEEK